MGHEIKAIDFMYYVATPEFINRWNEAKKGELICRMEKAIGGLPQYDSIEAMIARMDEAGVEKVFITQCKMWSYRIKESLQEIDRAVKECGFKGVYIHIYGFDIPLHDSKMYPLYAKCDELKIPVSLQVGHVLEAMPSEHARPIYLDRIASDFPDLKIVGAHTGWPWVEELISVCYKWDNVYFGVDAWMPKYMKPEIIHYINSRMGQDRCLWGTNGLPWKESLDQWEEMKLREETKKKLLRDNAVELFGLS
jgi:predicted TIM-barrel fold metal-dependent hydrolase